MISKDLLAEYAKDFDVELSQQQLDKFDLYAEALLDWNSRFNLTSITEPDEMLIKHFIDSISVLKAVNFEVGSSLIDVGTGAGFPSTPLAIVREDLKITQLDSLKKRVDFLSEIAKLLELDINAVHKRAEQGAKEAEYRESFDYVTARAVASLNVLCEYCLPYIKPRGYGIFLKGYEIEQELEQAQNSINILGCEVSNVEKLMLPMNYKRSIIIVKKISQTPANYPRNTKKIKNFSL